MGTPVRSIIITLFYFSMLDPTISMNANNSEIVQCLSDDSDFEIEITDGYFHNTINIDIIPKSNTIKFRRNPECDHVTESDKCDLVVASGRHEACKTSSVVETKQPNAVLDRPEENGSEEVLSEDINGSDFIGWSDDGPGESETDEIDNIEIEIVDGECPGTVSINIVCDVPEINKGKGSTCLEQEHAKYEHTKNGKITSCTQQCQADESYCSSVYGSVNSQTNPDVDARAESMKLRVTGEDKLFTPKSAPLFSDLDDSLKRDDCLKEELLSEEQHISKNFQRFEILYDASEIISATQNENDIKLEKVDQSDNVESKNKRNQRFSLEVDQEKRFKVTNNTFVSKRQTNTGTGDFFQKRKSTNKRDETNSCILDDVDAVIPRVIPKSGKQVKFGDEISGNRLIQLSPEKRPSSDVISSNKAERSILKNSNPPQGSNIEAQVYYNSSYFNDNEDGNDDNLNDYSQPEHQNKEHQSPGKLASYSESSISSYKRPAKSSCQINGQQYFRSYHTYTRYYQPSKPRVDFNSANISILKRSKDEKVHNANTSCTSGKYHTDNKYSVLIKPPGSYTNTTNKNRVNHSPVSSFMTSGCNSSENNLSSTGNHKHSSRDKKKQQKKRGKPVTAETDIERFQRYLSTGQAKLTSKGHLDTRRLKLEYLLHIGDFSLKYKVTYVIVQCY